MKLIRWLNISSKWAWITLTGAIAIGLINFWTHYSYAKSYENEYPILPNLFGEITGMLSLWLLLPFILKLFAELPLQKANWPQRLLLYILAMIVMGLAHTTVMTVIRYPLFPVLGFGEYDPGDLIYRYTMETVKASPAFWFFYLGFLVYRRSKEKQEEALRLVAIQGELAEAKLGSLKNQLNPHFLFNTLNMISSVMYEDIKKADTLIANLSEFLRYSLAFEEVQTVTVKEEVGIAEKYVSLMKERFSERLEVSLEIDPNAREVQIPVFCLQPLIENAIKFTMECGREKGSVMARIKADGDRLKVRVEDNGPGPGETEGGTQVGLKNLRSRLETLYRGEASFSLANADGGGARAELSIPLNAEL